MGLLMGLLGRWLSLRARRGMGSDEDSDNEGAGRLREAWRARVLAAGAGGLASGPSALAQASIELPPGVTLLADLAYGEHPSQRLDVYRPAQVQTQRAPVIVYVHGGGWRRGDKAMARVLGHKPAHWTAMGVVFVSINHRLLADADVLTQADDLALALRHVQQQAAAWGGDASRMALVGHSAGAHLAAWLTADANDAAQRGLSPWRATVALDSAALDMVAVMSRPHYRFYDPVFGDDPAFWRLASPWHRLQSAPVCALLLVCCAARADSVAASQQFADRVLALGGRAELLALPWDHAQINQRLGTDDDYTRAVDQFLASAGVLPS